MWEIELHPEQTLFFIHKHQVPAGRKATYANAVCDYRPLEDDPYRVRLTVGGEILIYPGDPRAPATSLLDSKLVFNSTISTPAVLFFLCGRQILFFKQPNVSF